MKRPANRRYLDIAINELGKKYGDGLRIRRTMANVIVAQMLPGGVIKGGGAIKLRYGDEATRFTRDLDAAGHVNSEEYSAQFSKNLQRGWCDFTGRLVVKPKARPRGVPTAYVMRPFEVKLAYKGQPWLTVPFELGANELGDAEDFDMAVATDAEKYFVELGLPAPGPIPLMSLSHQIAQKLHGLTEPGSDRVRDLVDIQLIVAHSTIDFHRTHDLCIRLFNYRKLHTWPPKVVKGEEWDSLYANAKEMLPILNSVDEAIVWANALIERIDNA